MRDHAGQSKPSVTDMDRLTSMGVFVKAVDMGSFAAAADDLGISAPMVGKHVRSLEERLGVRLLNRTTRRQSLTDFGRAYYERCRSIIREVDAADDLAADHQAAPRGRLRVSVPVHFGRQCAAPVLMDLARKYTALELEVSFSDRLTDLAEDGFDLVVRTGHPEDHAGIVARRIARQRMIVCASPSYLAGHGTPANVAELNGHAAVVYRRSGPIAPWLFPDGNGQVREFLPNGRFRFDDLAAIADAVAAGAGLGWLPSWLVRDRVRTGALVELLPGQPWHPYDVFALWLRTPHLPLRTRAAVEALAAELPHRVD